jgi:RHS repeat-associated protein
MQKLDATGEVAMSVAYDAFGQLTSGQLVGEYGFSSKPRITGINWYYYGYRYYDPETGRWPNRDPKGRRGGLNLYGMVENNPIGVWDLLGLQGCKPCKNKKDGKPGEFSESGRHLLNAFYFLAGHPARFWEMKCKCNGEMICPRKPCKRKCKVTVLTETTSTGDWGDALNDRFAQIPAGEPGHGLNVDTATANMINDNFDQIKQDAVDDFKKRCNDACK